MQRTLLLIAIAACYSSTILAQSIDSVTKLVIMYAAGGYPFGRPGIYSHSEMVEFDRRENSFIMQKLVKTETMLASDRVTIYRDTNEIKPSRNANLATTFVKSLINELNINRNNFTSSCILPLLKRPTKRQIRNIAAKYEDTLTNGDYDHMERHIIYKRIRSFYRLDSFLSANRPDTLHMVTVDAWDKCLIFVVRNSDTVRYDMDFLQGYVYLGQSIEKFHLPNFLYSTSVINLNVNKFLRTLLPESGLLYKRIDFNILTEYYIKWFFENGLGNDN